MRISIAHRRPISNGRRRLSDARFAARRRWRTRFDDATLSTMDIDDRVGLDPLTLATLQREVGRQRTLDEVVRWALADTPPRLVADVVVQDEYTHDVVVPYRTGVYLVYDTT